MEKRGHDREITVRWSGAHGNVQHGATGSRGRTEKTSGSRDAGIAGVRVVTERGHTQAAGDQALFVCGTRSVTTPREARRESYTVLSVCPRDLRSSVLNVSVDSDGPHTRAWKENSESDRAN